MKTKYTPILCTILLITVAISGCTDADAPSNLFDENTWQQQLDNGIKMEDAENTITPIAKISGLGVDVIRSEVTGDITSIRVTDDKNNGLTILEDDGDPLADRIKLNGKTLYPTAQKTETAEATSPQTQLSDAPGSSTEEIVQKYTADGSTIFLNNLVITNPQTPEEVAVAMMTAWDNADMNLYERLVSEESGLKTELDLTERMAKQYPDIISMTIESSEEFKKRGGGFGYEVKGDIELDDGKTLQYMINLDDTKKVTSFFIK